MRFRFLFCAVFTATTLVLSHSGNACAEWLQDVDAGIFYDSNLSRAPTPPDERADTALDVSAALGRLFAPTSNDLLAVTAFARADWYQRYTGLDVVALGVRAHWRHKFAVGYDAPWLAVALDGSRDDYRDTLRDSRRLELKAELGRRFTPVLDGAFGVALDRRYDNNGTPVVPDIPGDVFNLRGVSGDVRLGYAITDAWLLGARAAVRRGDVESTAQPSLPIFLASSAIAEDHVFGGDDLYAYRLRGTTWTAALSASLALDDRTSLNFSFAGERTNAAYGLQYSSRVAGLLLAYRP